MKAYLDLQILMGMIQLLRNPMYWSFVYRSIYGRASKDILVLYFNAWQNDHCCTLSWLLFIKNTFNSVMSIATNVRCLCLICFSQFYQYKPHDYEVHTYCISLPCNKIKVRMIVLLVKILECNYFYF